MDSLKIYQLPLLITTLLLVSSCGIGLCVGGGGIGRGGCPLEAGVEVRLMLSGLEGLSIRKNDCYPITISAVDSLGNPATGASTSVTLSPSSGVVLYSSLLGCQTYDSALEQNTFTLAATASQVVLYLRSDTTGPASLTASTSGALAIVSGEQTLEVQEAPFDTTNGPDYTVYAVSQDSNGDIYLGGDFTAFDDAARGRILRLNSDGGLDSAFSTAGSGFNSTVQSIAPYPGGKVVAGGNFSSYNGTTRGRLAMLNADGSLDTDFALPGSGFNNDVYSVVVQPNGKVVALGAFWQLNGVNTRSAARLNADGGPDATFALSGSGFTHGAFAGALQADGKIVVGGLFTAYNGTARNFVARLNSNGTLDTSFAPVGSGLSGYVRALAIQADGKIVVGGFFSGYNGTSRPKIARLNANGTLDTTFVPGTGFDGMPQSLSIQADGKILVGGEFTSYEGTSAPYVARLNSDGSLDSSFSVGTGASLWVYAIAALNDGTVVAGGYFLSFNGGSAPYLARLSADGILIATPGATATGLDDAVVDIALQPDGKAILGGHFRLHNGASSPHIARMNLNGSLDTTFVAAGSGFSAVVGALAVQVDGKVIAGGAFTAYNGTSRRRVARLNSDGSLDGSFVQSGTGLNDEVSSISLQADGKIMVGGYFTSYNGTSRRRIARIQADGTLDETFAQVGTGLNDEVEALAPQPDGKIIVGGDFVSYNGTPRPYLARLNPDGSLDATFTQSGTGLDSSVTSVLIQTDGKLVVGGYFTAYNGTPVSRIARVNADGSLDPSFLPSGTGLNSSVFSLAQSSSNKILVCGSFTAYDGIATPYLVRLNDDGTRDTTFSQTGIGLGATPYVAVETVDKKILVGGVFRNYNLTTARFLARLIHIGSLD